MDLIFMIVLPKVYCSNVLHSHNRKTLTKLKYYHFAPSRDLKTNTLYIFTRHFVQNFPTLIEFSKIHLINLHCDYTLKCK